MPALPVVKALAMRETVAEAVRNALLEGRFAPGESLSEVELATEMQVSRGPVREALLLLAQDGLVTHTQNRGFRVLEFTPADRAHVEQVRLPLEAAALELARDRVSAADLRDLEALKDRLVRAFEGERAEDVTRSELEFHILVYERSGNPWLASSLRGVMVPYFTFMWAARASHPPESPEHLNKIHQMYIDYLAGNNQTPAIDCVRYHLAAE
jgi:DNA-binding GntR family transcriptional regulator